VLFMVCGSIFALPLNPKLVAPQLFWSGSVPRRPRSGDRLLLVTTSITNLGPHIVCTRLRSSLEARYGNLYSGDVRLEETENVIYHPAPNQQLHGSILFEVRSGADPEAISFGQVGNTQGCTRESDFVRPTELRLPLPRQ
jgi:hypothetical protein